MVFNLNQTIFYGVIGILLFWLGLLTFFFLKLKNHYDRLVGGEKKQSLSETLEKILKNLDLTVAKINELETKVKQQQLEDKNYLQKIGLVRFNPFEEVGGDQSFVLAMLDGKNDGIVITSLHSRTGTRWYGKTINDGQGVEHELSKEEERALRLAQAQGKPFGKLRVNPSASSG